MKDLRIALFTGNYNHIKDGVSLTLNRLVRFLESKGVEVLVFGPSIPNPPIDHAGKLLEVPSIAPPGRGEYRVSLFLPEVYKLELEDFKPDIIHIATPDILGLIALRYARKNNIPLVSSYHTHFTSYLNYYKLDILEPLLWKYLRWFYDKCEKVFVPSLSMIDWLKGNGFDDRLVLWSRGVDLDLFNPDKRDLEWRRSVGIKDDEIVVGFVSRLVWEKDLRTVISVAKKLFLKNASIRILVGGDGPAMAEMQAELPEAVYVGHKFGDELARVYASSDVFLFPSDTEAFGNVTLEALSSGVPAVVSDAVGSSSIVIDGESGYLTTPKDIDAFVNNIYKLCEDGNMRKQMSVNARKRATTFEWDAIMNGLLNDYYSVLKSKQQK